MNKCDSPDCWDQSFPLLLWRINLWSDVNLPWLHSAWYNLLTKWPDLMNPRLFLRQAQLQVLIDNMHTSSFLSQLQLFPFHLQCVSKLMTTPLPSAFPNLCEEKFSQDPCHPKVGLCCGWLPTIPGSPSQPCCIVDDHSLWLRTSPRSSGEHTPLILLYSKERNNNC